MDEKISVVLLCGGIGSRMQSSIPKQFLKINQKLIAHYSFDIFKRMPEVAEIVVVCDLAYKHYFSFDCHPVHLNFALPGKRRQDSVFNGLNALKTNSKLVCIHDSARPLITEELVRRVIHAAQDHGAATASMPLKFTIKERDGNLFVKNTPDRTKYFEIQTPQIIRTDILKKGFEFIHDQNLEVTDDVSLVEYLGHPVKLVEGCYKNLKVTTPDDLSQAEYLIDLLHK